MSGRCQSRHRTELDQGTLLVRCSRPGDHTVSLSLEGCQGNVSVFVVRVCDEHVQAATGWH